MAPHCSTFAWKIPWMEEPGRLQSMGSLESATTEQLHFHFSLSCIGEGNGNSLQCSCLENPRDGRAWWAAVYGVAQSRTRLKRRRRRRKKKEEEGRRRRSTQYCVIDFQFIQWICTDNLVPSLFSCSKCPYLLCGISFKLALVYSYLQTQ